MKTLKKQGKDDSPEYKQLDLKQNILKIIANSTAYGIYIEARTVDTKAGSYCL